MSLGELARGRRVIMLRNLLGVVLGYSLWTGLWLGGNALLFHAASEQIAAEHGV